MSQGQATRSTFTLARVTHFIATSKARVMIKLQIGRARFPRWNSGKHAARIDHELLPRANVRIDIFPDDRALAGDFKEAAKPALVDERIAVRQTLGVRNSGDEWSSRCGPLSKSSTF